MDRREFVQGVGGALTAAQAIAMGIDVASLPVWGKELNNRPAGYAGPEGRDGPYDAVAVLEAMRERNFGASWCLGHTVRGGVFASWIPPDTSLFGALERMTDFPDFPSAVRWLHVRAAGADAEFAAKWPVPE